MDFIGVFGGVAEKFKSLDRTRPIKIVSNHDCDGIASASILVAAFRRDGIKFSLSVVRQLNQEILNGLKLEPYETIIFADLGSGYLSNIERVLTGKNVFILDHHKPEEYNPSFVVHINPHLFNLDGTKDISAAGVCYLFVKALNEENMDLAHLAIIGAIGDNQEKNGFFGVNSLIMKDAVEHGRLEIKESLRMFGMQTKPLYKVLEYSTNPYIPNVTGNERGAVKFLEDLNIRVRDGSKFRKLSDLSEEEMKKLITAIILKRMGSEESPGDVFGQIYLIKEEDDESPTRDAREFSTLLNCCGRLGKPSLGIAACLGDKKMKETAIGLLNQYRREIISSLEWFYKNRGGEKIKEGRGYVLINAEDSVRDTLIGTLTSTVAKSNIYPEGTIIVSLAHTLGEETKVSTRIAGFRDSNFDLREMVKKVVKVTGGEGGGHRLAAGATIPQEKEEEFLKLSEQILIGTTVEEIK